jgi:hypothetical protein
MKTLVEFKSNKFPSFESDVEGVNWSAGVFGKRLSNYLVANFPKHGIEVARHLHEDWGWYIEIAHGGGYECFVGCGSYQEFENGFLCFVEPSKPFVRKWFRKIDVTAQTKKVADALNIILTSDPEITAVRWWAEDEK